MRYQPFTRGELLAAAPGRAGTRRPVGFQDIDAAGIVFFPRILAYCHDALFAFFNCHGVPIAQILREGIFLAPIKHAEADYMAPLRFGDTVEVALVKLRLEETQVTIGYRVTRGDGVVAAVAQTLQVSVDGRTFGRIPFPEVFVQAYAAID